MEFGNQLSVPQLIDFCQGVTGSMKAFVVAVNAVVVGILIVAISSSWVPFSLVISSTDKPGLRVERTIATFPAFPSLEMKRRRRRLWLWDYRSFEYRGQLISYGRC